jgi:hypothetical protein
VKYISNLFLISVSFQRDSYTTNPTVVILERH